MDDAPVTVISSLLLFARAESKWRNEIFHWFQKTRGCATFSSRRIKRLTKIVIYPSLKSTKNEDKCSPSWPFSCSWRHKCPIHHQRLSFIIHRHSRAAASTMRRKSLIITNWLASWNWSITYTKHKILPLKKHEKVASLRVLAFANANM